MNDMKELWIDLNFYYISIWSKLYIKFIYLIIAKFNNFIFLLNISFYFILFSTIKYIDLFRMHSLSELTAINYPEYFFNFELIYIFISYKLNLRFLLKLNIAKEFLVLSLSNFFFNANWLEREVWDLFGIKFICHNDLRRILTDYGFSGHPLLKFFPLMGFSELRYDDSLNKIIREQIEMTQAYRYFIYNTPWFLWYL